MAESFAAIVIYLHLVRRASMKLAFSAILALAAICVLPAIGENTADFWSAEARQSSLNGNYEKAIASYDRALELDTSNETLLIGKGLALANLGRYSEAIDTFDQALASNPSNADIWYFKGLALSVGLERYEESISSFDKALEINPDYYDAWMSRGLALGNIGKLDDSLASFEAAIRINPMDPKSWNNRGVVLLEQGKYEDARLSFDKALELDPDYVVAQDNKKLTQQDPVQDNFYELDDILYRAKQREASLML